VSSLLDSPEPSSWAASRGLESGDRVIAVNNTAIQTWRDLELALRAARPGQVELAFEKLGVIEVSSQELAKQAGAADTGDLLNPRSLGLRPMVLELAIGQVLPQSAAEAAGIQAGDRLLRVNEQAVRDAKALIDLIRRSPNQSMLFEVERDGERLRIELTPRIDETDRAASQNGLDANQRQHARIGASLSPRFDMVQMPRDWFNLIESASIQTWHVTSLTVTSLWRMLTGELSWRQLGGPVSIADQAGQSAQRGANAYLGFLAVLSIGLFVLNMIPLPMLDGGHLVYCAIELIRGRALSEALRLRLQQLGLTAILALTMIALWNDFSRFF
jgi:regulator of sigma E protease